MVEGGEFSSTAPELESGHTSWGSPRATDRVPYHPGSFWGALCTKVIQQHPMGVVMWLGWGGKEHSGMGGVHIFVGGPYRAIDGVHCDTGSSLCRGWCPKVKLPS